MRNIELDTLIIALCFQIWTLALIDTFHYHGLGQECLVAVLNTLLTVWMTKRKK